MRISDLSSDVCSSDLGPAAGADHRRANSVAHFASGAVRDDDIICFDGLDFVRIAPAGTDENLVTTLLKAEELSADPDVDIFEFLELVPKKLFKLILWNPLAVLRIADRKSTRLISSHKCASRMRSPA